MRQSALEQDAAREYCTQECHDSIQTFQKKINSGCGTKQYELYQNDTTKTSPAMFADGLMWAYSLTCIQDSCTCTMNRSDFCLKELYGRNRTACSDCTMKYGAVMVSSDYGRRKLPPKAYSSLQSSCGVPASSYPYNYTPLPTGTPVSGTPTGSASATSTPTCAGQTYVSQGNDTCHSISKTHSISTDRLIEANHLDYACSSLSPGTELCIKDTCTVYTVQSNETCQDIIRGQSFGLVQLIGWNPTIHQNCDNLDSMVGRSICVSPPGGGEFTLPKNRTSSSRGLASSIVSSWIPGETTMMSNITTSWYSPTINTDYTQPLQTLTMNSTLASLLAERTQYCWIDYADNDYDEDILVPDDLAQNCQTLYSTYCDPEPTAPIPSSRPAIPPSCTPTVPSTTPASSTPLKPSSTVITTPSPIQTGMTHGCTKFHKVQEGEPCQDIADDNGVSLADLISWNPAIGSDCRTLQYDYYVCVGKPQSTTTPSPTNVVTPTPTQTGMADHCNKFHKVKQDESCETIANDAGISSGDLISWNPAIGDDCRTLKYDFYVCVGRSYKASGSTSASTTSRTTSTASTTTNTTGATPSPTQSGMVQGCKTFHMVKQGEYCQQIADDYNVSLNDLLNWNPAVGQNCESLKYDFYLCVGK
ncbi:hypothetical protein ASPWEDRAFT_140622 [Aspergillus wentii DTO 134E9]|uniref:LysM domain-containing protein n=1 Tax=Aspergillus wentii DTO 134E9 TaxID=1073089 RepID=A0A1L9R7E6_ASPWE|nr:uncharacterized protein ASPWEDRAFT_140622 [Aspergillus wentii DTO 134E9]OJJ30807.1 hypothetical protein ASPWEDRAFT_140622 [Aspergillus wentii DTO 134E9]